MPVAIVNVGTMSAENIRYLLHENANAPCVND